MFTNGRFYGPYFILDFLIDSRHDVVIRGAVGQARGFGNIGRGPWETRVRPINHDTMLTFYPEA